MEDSRSARQQTRLAELRGGELNRLRDENIRLEREKIQHMSAYLNLLLVQEARRPSPQSCLADMQRQNEELKKEIKILNSEVDAMDEMCHLMMEQRDAAKALAKESQKHGMKLYNEKMNLQLEMAKLEETEKVTYIRHHEREIEMKWRGRIMDLQTENDAMKYERLIHFNEREDIADENKRLKKELEEMEKQNGKAVEDPDRVKLQARLAEMDREMEVLMDREVEVLVRLDEEEAAKSKVPVVNVKE
ncbi:hypothetical protein FKW77_000917 [Venturia effusa]|uniref:Uncharacterized protein n=1 Tax=Venturia effusa TaxID=50376 RepID=A0A517LM43_9PEZI|nr:hypothetical protein FKW77_000917 [Venturia effusa]